MLENCWLVIDVRTAQNGVDSGIARVVIGLSRALVEEIEARRLQSGQEIWTGPRVMFVSKYDAPQWVVDLVYRYPSIARFWSGGPGALTRKWDKPVYLWSSVVLKYVKQLTGGNFFWLAPANFDRPMFSTRHLASGDLARIVQIIHDGIPFLFSSSMGFLFRWQFRLFVGKTLAKFPNVFTGSEHAAQFLKSVCKKRKYDIGVLGYAVDQIFGQVQRPKNSAERLNLRTEFLSRFLPSGDKSAVQLARTKWVVGVGRTQKYKNWTLAEQAVLACHNQGDEPFLLVRVGASAADLAANRGEEVIALGSASYFPGRALLVLPQIDDQQLAQLYRVSDVLVHPSLAEGFGLPPVEVALSGLPVVFRAGTAVEEHFSEGALPRLYWRRLNGDDPAEWAKALKEAIVGDRDMMSFVADMQQSRTPREFVLKYAGGKRFNWREPALRLLTRLEEGPRELPR